MSDIAIFIASTVEDLKPQGQLPGDIGFLANLADDNDRVVHIELVLDAPGADKAVQSTRREGGSVRILPIVPDAATGLATGLTQAVLNYLDSFPDTSRVILAGPSSDRLLLVSAEVRRRGCSVTIASSERRRQDATNRFADEVETWGKAGGRERSDDRPQQDPYEVLVAEVTKSRKNGRRVLLTSLKQRMRRRIRRFDETKLKDSQGKPIRKFKDFVVDAAERELVKIVEIGKATQVVLPDEDADAILAEAEASKDVNVDPLLDSVDLVDKGRGEKAESNPEEISENSTSDEDAPETSDAQPAEVLKEQEAPLIESEIDTETLDEDSAPPPVDFMEVIESILGDHDGRIALGPLLQILNEKQQSGELGIRVKKMRAMMQSAFNNELLERHGDDEPATYQLADDWRDIIGYL